ncbi:MAG: hypothetical protein ACYDB9_05445 [Gammaproteobacteria bacterium]
MATAAVQCGTEWRPNPFASVFAGILATAALLAALVFIFSAQPPSGIPATAVKITLGSAKAARIMTLKSFQPRHRPKHAAGRNQKQRVIAKPVRLKTAKNTPPESINWQQQIDSAAKAYAQRQANPSEILLPHTPADADLQHAMQTPRKPPVMQNGESYRSIYGGTIVKSHGVCTRLQTAQIGPSPDNRTTIVFLTPCPGEYKPGAGRELLEWANKKRAKMSGPPR